MKNPLTALAAILVVPVVAISTSSLLGSSVSAQIDVGLESTGQDGTTASLDSDIIAQGINMLLAAVGVLSVVMLIWGGILYTTSAGNNDKVKSAKNTILYAVIGLVVALFAFAITQWVVATFTG